MSEHDEDEAAFDVVRRFRERHILDPFDILTDEQMAELRADLAEMAKRRRRAEAESAHWVLP